MPMALCRPIEVTTSNDTFTVSYDGGAATPCALTNGVYGCILTLLDELEDAIQAVAATADVFLSSDWEVQISAGVGHTIALVFSDTALGKLLGFSADPASGGTARADYTPEYCWLPTFENANPVTWTHAPTFAGGTSVTGLLSGVSLTSARYTAVPRWPVERDYNSKISRAVTEDVYGGGATVYYPQADRCFEQFFFDIRDAAPTMTTADGLNMKGFYLIHDRSVYATSTPTVAIPSSMTSGGVQTELSTTPDYYVYCSIAGDARPSIELSADGQNLYYDVSIPVHTATAPTWNVPT